jgi:hypothetical protein
MKRPFIWIAAIAGLVPSTGAHASHDSQVWTTQVVNVKFADKWRLQEEVVERFSDSRHGLYEIESNTLLGYRLNKVTTLWGGYTHDPQYSGGHFTVTEQRLREQVTFDGFAKLGPGKLSARLRVEQRWRDGIGGTGWRLRPFLKYSVPVHGKTSLNLSTEPVVDLNTTGFQRTPGLDRVRNLISISTPLAKSLTGEAGYLNQHGFVRGGEDSSDHVAYFAVSLSL